MTPNELRQKTPEELSKLLTQFREELFRLKLKKSTGQLEKNHRIKEVRKDVARVLTLSRQKKA